MGEVLRGVEEGLGGHVMFGADAAFPMFRLMLKSRAATGGTGRNTLLGCNGLESVVRRATTTLADLGVSGGNGVCLTLLDVRKEQFAACAKVVLGRGDRTRLSTLAPEISWIILDYAGLSKAVKSLRPKFPGGSAKADANSNLPSYRALVHSTREPEQSVIDRQRSKSVERRERERERE